MRKRFGLDLHETGDDKLVSLQELFVHFEYNPEISKIEGVSSRFWDQVVIDGLLANNDRNNGNWGILAKGSERSLAPIFDNGSSFYPKKSEDAINGVLSLSEEDFYRNCSNTVLPYTLDGIHHLNYRQILSLTSHEIPSSQTEELNKAIKRNIALVDSRLNEIKALFDAVPEIYSGHEVMSSARKDYYLRSFLIRFNGVLKKARN